MNQLEYIASDGKFVVGKSFQSELWVYDIDIYLFSVKIAVVGFTNKNLNGAIFFQDICYEHDKYNLDSEDILKVAKEYFHEKKNEKKKIYFL